MPDGESGFDGVKVFSATTVGRREKLGEDIIAWLRAYPERVPVDTVVRQSSDARFHCFTIVMFWRVPRPSA